MSETKQISKVQDAHKLDSRIPSGLIMQYQGRPFILKAGLEWKANQLYGIGKWGMETEIVNYVPEKKYALVKARVRIGDVVYEDFGEASPENVSNPQMMKYVLHLAITRAGNRALRRATACGLTSYEELGTEETNQLITKEIKNESRGNSKPSKVQDLGGFGTPEQPTEKPVEEEPSLAQWKLYHSLIKQLNIDPVKAKERTIAKFKLWGFTDITKAQLMEINKALTESVGKKDKEIVKPSEIPNFTSESVEK